MGMRNTHVVGLAAGDKDEVFVREPIERSEPSQRLGITARKLIEQLDKLDLRPLLSLLVELVLAGHGQVPRVPRVEGQDDPDVRLFDLPGDFLDHRTSLFDPV